jgi:hypothetical protein
LLRFLFAGQAKGQIERAEPAHRAIRSPRPHHNSGSIVEL